MNKFKVILATSKDYVMGNKITNDLPWGRRYNLDMQYFKKLTSFCCINKNAVIMGKNTWLSLPSKSLYNRIPIVISTSLNYDPNCNIVETFEDALQVADKLNPDNIWVIGGKSVYSRAFNHHRCGEVYHNIIPETYLDKTYGDEFITLKLPFYDVLSSQQHEKINFNKYNLTGEFQYLRLLSKIINEGELRQTRNSKTWSLFNQNLEFDLEKDGFPLLTTKKMFWKGIVEELLFFIRGDTNTKHLEEKGVNIWKGNTTQEFIDKLKLPYQEGDMGPMYGFNWRHFGAEYKDYKTDYTGKGFDQLTKVIDEIKNNPTSRRIIMTDFNPAIAHQGVLYPCHSIVIQFYVRNEFLDLKMYQR